MNALLLIDIQNDFLPTGALPVPEGDLVIPIANALMQQFHLVAATQDWHPANHGSFAANHPGRQVGERIELQDLAQILWPIHCVQNTRGAELAATLQWEKIQQIVPKGTEVQVDSYSGFFDNGHVRATGLHAYLQTKAVTTLYLVGLATDYCVKYTALDARRLGYRVVLVPEGCRGVNIQAGDVTRAKEEMAQAGVEIMPFTQVQALGVL